MTHSIVAALSRAQFSSSFRRLNGQQGDDVIPRRDDVTVVRNSR